MRVAVLQLNARAGDVSGNMKRLLLACKEAQEQGAELCVAPELALCGYPPLGMLALKPLGEVVGRCLEQAAQELCNGPALLLGIPEVVLEEQEVYPDACILKKVLEFYSVSNLYNSVFLLNQGTMTRVCRKSHLDCCAGFADAAYFVPGDPQHAYGVVALGGLHLGVCLGQDVESRPDYIEHIDLLVHMSAESFAPRRHACLPVRLARAARAWKKPLLHVNHVGGNGSLVSCGRSLGLNAEGRVTVQAQTWAEDVLVMNTDVLLHKNSVSFVQASDEGLDAQWKALVLGIRDYVRKSGFQRVVLGLSGGMDSSLVAALAVEALGAAQVTGLLMPSPWSSKESLEDAHLLVCNLGIQAHTLPIEPLMKAYDLALTPLFAGRDRDVTEENIQARIRGNLLMALSNKEGSLLLATGNKSEVAVGYCTLYGDAAGSLAPIADVYKTQVYRLAHWYNKLKSFAVIPENVFDKAPSAELSPGQKDQDSLPPYDELDAILHALIEERLLPEAVCTFHEDFDPQQVAKVAELMRKSEFKRHQLPPALFVSERPLATLNLPVPLMWP